MTKDHLKLQALVHDILSLPTAIIGYAIGLWKLSATTVITGYALSLETVSYHCHNWLCLMSLETVSYHCYTNVMPYVFGSCQLLLP